MKSGLQAILATGAALTILAGCATTESGSGDAAGSDPGTVTAEADPAMPPGPPPAPPPPPVERSGTGALAEMGAEPSAAMDSIVVTGSRSLKSESPTERALAESKADRSIVPEPEPELPEPQAGLLTAGDYDDVLNPDLYKAYLDKVLQDELSSRKLPYVDADRRIAIKVVDRLGKPVPLAKISLTTEDGDPMFPLRTGADGLAYIYPTYDVIESGIKITVSSDGARKITHRLSQERLEIGGTVTFDLSKDVTPAEKLDLLLTIDATGSMGDEMTYLQAELLGILERLREANAALDIRAGFIVYRDEGDAYVVKEYPFTDDLPAFEAELAAQSARGGGDFPEAMHDALSAGLKFEWRDDAIKINMLVADAPPHDEHISETWDSGLISRTRGIHIVPIAASGVEKTAEFIMRGMAQITGGRYIFLTDDSGIGNPHAEPTVDCYVVTRLDSLVQRVLEGLVTGVRVEPDGEEVIRTVGNYRAGVCKLDDQETS
ncbi:MAG: vWA domain-containing protein [Pseudomonadota bacterium]